MIPKLMFQLPNSRSGPPIIFALLGLSFLQPSFAQDASPQDSAISIEAVPTTRAASVTPISDITPTSIPSGVKSIPLSPISKSSTAAKTHTVQVGFNHQFIPDTTEADAGDTVEFTFAPQNHSVVRAEYGYACIPYEMTGEGKQGFFSGFRPVSSIVDDPPKFSIKINDTNPIFFYCSAPGSCIDFGMVGAINPNSTATLKTQVYLAKNSTYMLQPGEPFPFESPTPTSFPPPSSSSSPSSSHHKPRLSPGAIAGVTIAALVVLSLLILLTFYISRSRTLKKEIHRKESTVARRTTPPSPSLSDILRTAVPSAQQGHQSSRSPPAYTEHYPMSEAESESTGWFAPTTPPLPLPPPSPLPLPVQRGGSTKKAAVPLAAHPAFRRDRSSWFREQLSHAPSTSSSARGGGDGGGGDHHYESRGGGDNHYYESRGGGDNHHHGNREVSDATIGAVGVNRSASVRSVGGVFDISSATGFYTRAHDGEDQYGYGYGYGDVGGDGEEGKKGQDWAPYEATAGPAELDGTAVDVRRS